MTTLSQSTRYTKRYRWRKANGINLYTDQTAARTHIHNLHALGITSAMIADAAGRSDHNIMQIANGATPTIQVDTERRILAVTHHPHPSQTFVLGVGVRRRIRALNAIGWPTAVLAARLGLAAGALNASTTNEYVTYHRWAQVRDLYNELSGTPGPNPNTSRNVQNKHAPPLAWYGRDMDHPHAQPDWAAAGIKLTQRSECTRGHLYSRRNTYRDKHGRRQCLTCRRAAAERTRAKRAAGAKQPRDVALTA